MNLAAIIDTHPDEAIALVSGADQVTYAQLRERSAAARAAVVAAGCVPGDRVAVIGGNTPDTVVTVLAAMGAGCIAVPLNPQSPAAELARELEVADVALTVRTTHTGAATEVAGERSLASLLSGDRPAAPMVDRGDDDPAVLVFTSGTAGAPRAATLTHGNLEANMRQVDQVAEMARRSTDRTLGLLPLFHVFGLNVVLLPSLRAGGCVVLVDGLDPDHVADLVRREGITLLTGPPTLWIALADLPTSVPVSTFASVRLAASGAAPLPVHAARAIHERFALRVHEGYGLTETSPVVATSVGTDAPFGSVGRPLPGVDVRLLDDDGADVLVGDVGHLHVRGPHVFPGYWRDDEATAAVLTPDGWLRTGDLAVVDDDGHLFLVDRAKDLVIVSGFNVFPAEVEAVLLTHPSVADAAVHGVPHPRTGETIVADVVPAGSPPAHDEAWFDELQAHLALQLSRYKLPTRYHLVASVPRGLGGKVQRRRLPDAEAGGPA